MYGIDLSSYQKGIDLYKGTFDFAIVKATEGVGFKDNQYNNFVFQLTEMDKLIGCYHFARPDLNGTIEGMKSEADWFIDTVSGAGLLGKSLLVLDWEREPFNRQDLVQAWLDRVYQRTHIVPFVYGSSSKLLGWKNWDLMKNRPTWIASYPNNNNYMAGENPHLDIPSNKIPWIIWQYSGKGKFPGFSGYVDLDYCKYTPADWKWWAKSKEDEEISDDMKWAIDIGLFKGGDDGKFYPREPLTREQAATLFRRFYHLIATDLDFISDIL